MMKGSNKFLCSLLGLMRNLRWDFGIVVFLFLVVGPGTLAAAQTGKSKKATQQAKSTNSLAKLREEFVQATKNYKASLEKLLASYERNLAREESRLTQSRTLQAGGLISKNQLDESERAVAGWKDKVSQAQHQLATAETQIADTLVETQADAKLARTGKLAPGATLRTTSYIRYNGPASWTLADAWKLQRFFQDTFQRPLPIGVFGQGAIHDRWRLDHRNAMDLSVNPDGAEGQALINFLRGNGIPFLAFREAIPGTATGPHIHVGRPSHRF